MNALTQWIYIDVNSAVEKSVTQRLLFAILRTEDALLLLATGINKSVLNTMETNMDKDIKSCSCIESADSDVESVGVVVVVFGLWKRVYLCG